VVREALAAHFAGHRWEAIALEVAHRAGITGSAKGLLPDLSTNNLKCLL
jgi:hypothetical protein